jgi:hypothetical protein
MHRNVKLSKLAMVVQYDANFSYQHGHTFHHEMSPVLLYED